MNESYDCQICPAFGRICEGSLEGGSRCGELRGWVDTLDGLAPDMALAPQPSFALPRFLPQILNGLDVPSMLAREPVVAVGVAKALTPCAG